MNRIILIAICEDQKKDMDTLAQLIERGLKLRNVPFEIKTYQSGVALLRETKPGAFDLLFLDMFLKEENGVEIARVIRATDPDCQIVFTTFSPEFALEGYQVRASHYLIKPISASDLEEVWNRCLDKPDKTSEVITLMIDRKPREIALSDILYIEVRDKLCVIYTLKEALTTRISIEQLAILLPGKPFCRCHRSYIVNFDHVKHIGDDFVMQNGDIVYIRQAELAEIREQYFRHMTDSAREKGTGL